MQWTVASAGKVLKLPCILTMALANNKLGLLNVQYFVLSFHLGLYLTSLLPHIVTSGQERERISRVQTDPT